MILRKSHSPSTRRTPLMALAALPLLALAGCQDMKNAMQGGFDKANATASTEADRQAAFARGEDPSATHSSDPTVSGARANPNANTRSQGAVAGSGANAGGSSSSTGGAHASSTSASDDVAMNDGAMDDGAMDDGDDGAYSDGEGDASYANGGGDAMPSEPTVTNRKEDVKIGTEHWGWTDAKIGWYVRFRYQGGMETSQEVVDATDDLLLMETKTIMPGMNMPASRTWQARRFVKYTGDTTTECKSDTQDLENVALSVGGKKVQCKVTEATTTCPGMAPTHSKSWMSDEVPGELAGPGPVAVENGIAPSVAKVKTLSDGQVVMELIEFRM